MSVTVLLNFFAKYYGNRVNGKNGIFWMLIFALFASNFAHPISFQSVVLWCQIFAGRSDVFTFFLSEQAHPTQQFLSYKDKDYGKDQKNRSDNQRPSFGAEFETATLYNSCCHFAGLRMRTSTSW